MVIAVDFDGTIVEHRFPKIGREKPFAFFTLKKLQAEGHILILWSVREGMLLDEAVEYCRSRGLEFHAINRNFPDQIEETSPPYCRKVRADLYIDDRNIGGIFDWGVIYEMIQNHWTYEEYYHQLYNNLPTRNSFWWWLLGR